MKFFLDEGAPRDIGASLENAGHQLIYFEEAANRGDPDVVVAEAAMANDAVLVAVDRDMRQIAKGIGIGKERFKRLSLLHFKVRAAPAIARVQSVLPYIELQERLTRKKEGRRIWMDVLPNAIKIYDL